MGRSRHLGERSVPATRSPAVSPDRFTSFGELLKFLRRRAGLTQRELSLAVGYSTSQISRLEQNERPPDAACLAARFVPALQLETEPDWTARLLELAAASRAGGEPPASEPAPTAPAPPSNLPIQLTSFIGRERDIAQVKRLLAASRLVTLTGPGGAGKTRLALRVAADLLVSFPDGVWLVDLAPLVDPSLVPQTVAAVLGVREQAGSPILATLTHYLRSRTTLLILDNCEHLIAACALFAETALGACVNVRLLAASREVLDAEGETTFPVPPLSAPDSRQPTPLDALAHYEAVRLFVDRARRVLPGFDLTDTNAPAVAQVCHELDGLPLAIEMAAARVKLLQVEQIAARLADRFQLLMGAKRTALPRHQTLAAVLDWSYELLSEPERALLRRLAVFAGGWTLEAAEQVCGDEPGRVGTSAVLDLLTSLVNKSLVVARRKSGQETRYYCLETIRQYALAKLDVSGDEPATRQRHAQYYCSLAETAEPLLRTAEQRRWLDQLQVDLDNFRAAQAWCQSTGGDAEVGLRLGSALGDFWLWRGLEGEGLAWLAAGLARGDEVTAPVRAQAIILAGRLAYYWGDNDSAHRYFEEGLLVSRTIGYTVGIGWSLGGLGMIAYARRDDKAALAMLTESLALFRQLGYRHGIALQLAWLGMLNWARGDYQTAQAESAESLSLFQQMGDPAATAVVSTNLGHLAWSLGDEAQAEVFYDQALALHEELGIRTFITEAYFGLAYPARDKGDYARAKKLLVEALVICRDFDVKLMIPYCLAAMGGIAVVQRRPDIAAKLLGAAAALWAVAGKRLGVTRQAEYDRDVAAAREQLDEAAFEAAWSAGQAMTPEQAIELALRT